MINCSEKKIIYVLFGKEAIQLFSISIELLLEDKFIKYKVKSFNDTRAFIKENKKWDEYKEINRKVFFKINANQKLVTKFI